jgi:hypothetical protein
MCNLISAAYDRGTVRCAARCLAQVYVLPWRPYTLTMEIKLGWSVKQWRRFRRMPKCIWPRCIVLDILVVAHGTYAACTWQRMVQYLCLPVQGFLNVRGQNARSTLTLRINKRVVHWPALKRALDATFSVAHGSASSLPFVILVRQGSTASCPAHL